MFCQQDIPTKKLISVSSKSMSDNILYTSTPEIKLSCQLINIWDLMAPGGKYHLSCQVNFLRTADKGDKMSKADIIMNRLSSELHNSASLGHVLKLSAVWDRYCLLANDAGIEISQSYTGRRGSFKNNLLSLNRNDYDFIVGPKTKPYWFQKN